jgi:hypothetical protein
MRDVERRKIQVGMDFSAFGIHRSTIERGILFSAVLQLRPTNIPVEIGAHSSFERNFLLEVEPEVILSMISPLWYRNNATLCISAIFCSSSSSNPVSALVHATIQAL